MPRSHARSRLLSRLFQASTDALKNTTEEWCSITAHHAVSTKAAQLHSAPSSSKGASPDATI
jgi:hypothetical protein